MRTVFSFKCPEDLLFLFLHPSSLILRSLVIVTGQMEDAVGQQAVDDVIHRDTGLSGLPAGGFNGHDNVAEHARVDLTERPLLHRKGDHVGGPGFSQVSLVEVSYSRIVCQEDTQVLLLQSEYF